MISDDFIKFLELWHTQKVNLEILIVVIKIL